MTNKGLALFAHWFGVVAMVFMLYVSWRYADPLTSIFATCTITPVLILFGIILYIHYTDKEAS
jgi:hypothetical protein